MTRAAPPPIIRVSMAAIRARHRGYWFSPATMRFFRSRVATTGYRGPDGRIFFVSSEQFDDHSPRRWTVRVMQADDISTVGTFQQYSSRRAADRVARQLAAGS